jgi:hypothetical protein
VPDYPKHDVSTIDIEVFGILDFEEPVVGAEIKEMKGSWYDLNGQMRTLGIFLREKTKAAVAANGAANDFKVKLSSLSEEHSVSAKMGDIEFKR